MTARERTLRFVAGTALVIAIMAVAFLAARPWSTQWGATADEIQGAMPGDELVPQPFYEHTLAITIDAPPAEVWPWVVQLGQNRGGFYTYDWLENLFGCNIHNADRIVPEWQQPAVGDFVSVCDGVGGWWIAVLDPERALVFRDQAGSVPVALVLRPADDGGTRLVARMRLGGSPSLTERLMTLDFWWTHAPMQRRMLEGIKARAEGQGDPSLVMALEVVVWLGAFFLGLAAAVLVVLRRNWRRPLAVGVAALVALLVITFLQPPVWVSLALVGGLLLDLAWAARPAPGRGRNTNMEAI
jgi:hypothetical protein